MAIGTARHGVRDDVCMFTCVWCKNEIKSGNEVWIERSIPNECEYSGAFCGDEHASLWVAKPFNPNPDGYDETWVDKLVVIGCLSTLAFLALFTVVGLVVSIQWLADALH